MGGMRITRVHMAPIHIAGGHHESFQTPRACTLARPRRRQRPDQSPRPARARHRGRGRDDRRRRGNRDRGRRRAAQGRSMEPRIRLDHAGGADAVAVREGRRALAEQSQGRVPQFARPHAASTAERHHHAEQPALFHQSLRRARHRPRQAQAGDPRHGAPAARVHAGVAVALPAGHAHGVRGMRRQFGADVLQRAAAGDGRSDPRPRLQLRMGRRAAVDAARRSRHRPQRQMARRRGRGCAVPRSQHSRQEGL